MIAVLLVLFDGSCDVGGGVDDSAARVISDVVVEYVRSNVCIWFGVSVVY